MRTRWCCWRPARDACVRAGYAIVNIDATIVVDRPKLAPLHRRDARKPRRRDSQSPLECVSVKAKTSEGMGYTGDGTGIAAYAVT